MDHEPLDIVRAVLKSALQLGARADRLERSSPLLGGLPEFDSMAVVTVVTMLEDQYGLDIDDDELSADVFATVGSLEGFISSKISQ
jgi:acyl carrier protein